jgi:hypothetical protein
MTTIVTAAELAADVEAFLGFKRAMGATYRRGQWDLERFVRFVARRWGEHGQVPPEEAITRWCERIPGRKAVTLGNEFGPIRQLCLHRRRRDPSSYVPEHALAPVKESTFLPYIFSQDEVRQILAAATAHKGRFYRGGHVANVRPLLHRPQVGRSSAIADGGRRSRPRSIDGSSQQRPFAYCAGRTWPPRSAATPPTDNRC